MLGLSSKSQLGTHWLILEGGVAGGNGCSGEEGEKGISLFRLCFSLESDFMCLRERVGREREGAGKHRERERF